MTRWYSLKLHVGLAPEERREEQALPRQALRARQEACYSLAVLRVGAATLVVPVRQAEELKKVAHRAVSASIDRRRFGPSFRE